MTAKRVFVVGPVFLESSSQTAMTLDLDGQAVAPADRAVAIFGLESSRCLLLKLLLLLGADLIRMYLVTDSGHHCVLVQSFKSIFAFTPLSSLSGVVADKLRI